MKIHGEFPGEPVFSTLRRFGVPREKVWMAWTDPDQLCRWWGPRGFTANSCEVDARAGGAIHIDMRGPDGTVYQMRGSFQEVVAPERLVFSSAALGPGGGRILEVLNTVTLAERDAKTTLTLHASVTRVAPEAAPYIAGMPKGWAESLDRLGEYVHTG